MAKSSSRSLADGGEVSPGVTSRAARESAINEARRTLILDAARSAFFELGLDGASLREIAKRAGYTPGALYSYFGSREALYAALLGESLARLRQCVVEAAGNGDSSAQPGEAGALLHARAMAFFCFYRARPQDMDLGFYLFNGTQPRGLTPELNQQLNDQLRAALLPIQEALLTLGLSADAAVIETTAIFAHAVGLLMLNNSGRIRLFRQDPQVLFGRFLDLLLARLGTEKRQPTGFAPRG